MFAVGELIVREQRLHKISEPVLRLMIKIDADQSQVCSHNLVHLHKQHDIFMMPGSYFLN